MLSGARVCPKCARPRVRGVRPAHVTTMSSNSGAVCFEGCRGGPGALAAEVPLFPLRRRDASRGHRSRHAPCGETRSRLPGRGGSRGNSRVAGVDLLRPMTEEQIRDLPDRGVAVLAVRALTPATSRRRRRRRGSSCRRGNPGGGGPPNLRACPARRRASGNHAGDSVAHQARVDCA
jgi:hypothetical protein